MKKNITADSLISKYFPADYVDSFSKEMACRREITLEEFCNLTFNQLPKWIEWLMNLRNTVVKPLGLDTSSRFTDMISESNPHEKIFGMPDKHLDFHVSMWCGEYEGGKQKFQITTVVKYNNWLGRVYFCIIRPFHGIIISSLLKHMKPPPDAKPL